MRGYTLLEMIVAVGIFSIVMLTATGAFLTLIRLDREARLTNNVVTNLSFAVDSIARALRTGVNYDCSPATSGTFDNCTSSSIAFRDEDNRAITYGISSGRVTANVDGIQSFLTDPNITVSTLSFEVRGMGTTEACGSRIEPQVTFTMQGAMTSGQGAIVDFTLQGGATRRKLELSASVCP
ncbi:MAG: type II secretion system protein [Minisyncoccia bacterium]